MPKPKKSVKPKPPGKRAKPTRCDVNHMFMCSGVGVITLQGVEDGDPVFKCCLGCRAWLHRNRIRTRPYLSPENPGGTGKKK